jgi:hypothetical protein
LPAFRFALTQSVHDVISPWRHGPFRHSYAVGQWRELGALLHLYCTSSSCVSNELCPCPIYLCAFDLCNFLLLPIKPFPFEILKEALNAHYRIRKWNAFIVKALLPLTRSHQLSIFVKE